MINSERNRLSGDSLDPSEVEAMHQLLASSGCVRLTDDEGNSAEIPQMIFEHLLFVVRMMQRKQAIVLIPEDEAFTTQAAADYLGMSRQHLVNLLDSENIPFHRVGTHRRVYFKDLKVYEKRTGKERRTAFDELSREIHDAGLYYTDETVTETR